MAKVFTDRAMADKAMAAPGGDDGAAAEAIASHWLVDCYGCRSDRLRDAATLERVLMAAADRGNLSVLRSQRHQFHPQGATVLLLLSESHLSLHTWPERHYAALDLFTCGDRANPAAACQTVLDFLCPRQHQLQHIARSMVSLDPISSTDGGPQDPVDSFPPS